MCVLFLFASIKTLCPLEVPQLSVLDIVTMRTLIFPSAIWKIYFNMVPCLHFHILCWLIPPLPLMVDTSLHYGRYPTSKYCRCKAWDCIDFTFMRHDVQYYRMFMFIAVIMLTVRTFILITRIVCRVRCYILRKMYLYKFCFWTWLMFCKS